MKKTSEHPQHSRAIANSIAGRVGEHPSEKDQHTGELHAKENQGGDKCEGGDTPDTDSLSFRFHNMGAGGVPSKRL